MNKLYIKIFSQNWDSRLNKKIPLSIYLSNYNRVKKIIKTNINGLYFCSEIKVKKY